MKKTLRDIVPNLPERFASLEINSGPEWEALLERAVASAKETAKLPVEVWAARLAKDMVLADVSPGVEPVRSATFERRVITGKPILKKGDHFRFTGEGQDRIRIVTNVVDDIVFADLHSIIGVDQTWFDLSEKGPGSIEVVPPLFQPRDAEAMVVELKRMYGEERVEALLKTAGEAFMRTTPLTEAEKNESDRQFIEDEMANITGPTT